MKLILVVFVFVSAFVNAEPPRYSSSYANAKSSDPDFEIHQVEVIEVPWQEESDASQQGNYGPPQQGNVVPEQEYGPPQQEYGPPKQEYGPPQQEYGPPKPVYGPPAEPTTTEWDQSTTTEYPTTTETYTNATNNQSAKLKQDFTERGVYYVYHPNGILQRVAYSTKDDVKNMAYSAQLKYQNVEPINGPIYSYDPVTYQFQRFNK